MNEIYDVVDTYQVIDNQSFFLSVQVGNAQLRSHNIRLDFDPVGDGIYEHNVENLEIGLGLEIRSQTLYITSNIANNMSLASATITYTLTGGLPETKIIPYEKAFNGQSAIAIKAKIKLT